MTGLRTAAWCLAIIVAGAMPAGAYDEVQVLKSFRLDSLDGVITQSGVSIDKEASEGKTGCLKITSSGPQAVRLFEVTGLDVDNARLVYQARLKTKDATDKVFLEMWCRFPGRGEFFSRGLDRPLTGTTGWTTEETSFFLKKGEKPDLIRLNVHLLGKGTVWIEDMKLIKEPLK